MTTPRISQLAVVAVSESLPPPIRVTQIAVVAPIIQAPPSIQISQLAVVWVIGDGRKTISLGNPIKLNCWQPCTAYGTTATIVYLGGNNQ